MLLRPRQEQFVRRCLSALREHGNTLGLAPTGAGKTVMLSAAIPEIMEATGKPVLVLQHRDELVAQNRRTFHALNGTSIASGVFDAGTKQLNRPVTFAMVQSIVKRAEDLPEVGAVVTDEAHHGVAPSYVKLYEAARAKNPGVLLFGVTATPARADKKSLRSVYDNVADQITLRELVLSGALVPPRAFHVDIGVRDDLAAVKKVAGEYDMQAVASIMDKEGITSRIIAEWAAVASDRQTVWFGATVAHCEHVAEALRAAGYTAAVVHADLPDDQRQRILRSYDRGEIQHIVNVAVLTEGWDCQPVSCVVLLRPSSHISTMIQMVGRGLRRLDPERYPGRRKTDCIVIDFGTSLRTHGSLEPEIDMRDPKEKGPPPKKVCPSCGGEVPASAVFCGLCGADLATPAADGEDVDAEPKGEAPPIVLREIDILNASPFGWEALWDGAALVACGGDAWAAVVAYHGLHVAVGGAEGIGIKTLGSGERAVCVAVADDFLRDHGNKDSYRKSRTWLHVAATDRQRAALRLAPGAEPGLTKYRAMCLLTFLNCSRAIEGRVMAAARGA